MTIRFIKSWNGYYEGQIVTSPNGRSEADLVTLGYAVTDLDGPDNSPLPVTASKTLTGGIKNITVVSVVARPITRKGNLGTRILSGRMGVFDNSTVKTFRAIIEVAAQGFDMVRPIFANGNASTTYTVAGCNVRALANLTDALPSPTTATLPSSGVVAANPSSRRSFLLGDWIDLTSVPRTDGGYGALVCIDAHVSTASNITILGNGTSDNYTGWAARTNRKWIMRHNDGDCVTTPASFVSTTNRIQSPIIGLQYAARGRVITVMGVGDSITDGRGSIVGEGFGVPACEAMSSSDLVFEWANMGWASANSGTFRRYLSDAIAAGIVPDVVVAPVGSPNSFAKPIVSASINDCRIAMAQINRDCGINYIQPVFWTVLPTNPVVNDYNASDSLRRDYNAATLAYPDTNVLDFSAALSGATDGDGQVGMLAGTTTDDIHPNDSGNAILAGILANAMKSFF